MQPQPEGAGPGAVLAMLRELPGVSRSLTLATAATVVVSALVRPALAVASGLLIGSIPDIARNGWTGPAGSRLTTGLVATVLLFALSQIVGPLQMLVSDSLGRRAERATRTRLMQAACTPPTLTDLEDPAVQDDIASAQSLGWQQATVWLSIVSLASWGSAWLGGLLAAVVVARFSIPLAVAIAIAYTGVFLLLARSLGRSINSMVAQTQDARRAAYLRDLTIGPGAAKEVRVFDLGGWLVERFDRTARQTIVEARNARANGWWVGPAAGLGLALTDGLAILVIGRAAVRGEITLGEMTTFASAAAAAGGLLMLDSGYLQIMSGAATVRALHRVEARARAATRGGVTLTASTAPDLRFEHVAFTYPGQERPVFSDLSLVIPGGQSLAIVGENGAGKTTLVKLLAGLYIPDTGRITVDDEDLAIIDPDSWRSTLAAIFQDFTRYELTARQNVGFGAVEHMGDDATLDRVAERAGAARVVADLPNGWDTTLSRQYEDGVEPSGGQWQRIALARALMAVEGGARLLVLDEPTANLDVRAEAELYDRFLDLTAGLTTVLISHRFSTVRRAHHIVLLEHGAVREQGSHDELMALGGRYAEMFELQASRFAEEDGIDA